jgi:hypothetical protein
VYHSNHTFRVICFDEILVPSRWNMLYTSSIRIFLSHCPHVSVPKIVPDPIHSVHCVIISMSMIRTRWHRYHHTPYILFLRKASSGIEDTSFELAYTLRRSRLPLCLHFQHHRDYVRFRNVEHTCKHEGSNDIPSNDIPNEMPSASPRLFR